MFTKKPTERAEELDELITDTIHMMKLIGPTHEEYPQLLSELERLTKLREQEKPKKVDPNTLWTVGGTIAGTALIILFETRHVMTSKAFGSFVKPKGLT